jgi:hypothetical protein
MNVLFLFSFGLTLFQGPPMIYRFAVLQDKSIPNSPGEKRIAEYCRKVTGVWILFFVFNGSMAAFTIFSGSDTLWSVYNGGVSYILIGVLFAGEYIIRKKVQKKMPKTVSLSEFNDKSRDRSTVICYDGAWSDNERKTYGDFLEGTAVLRRKIESVSSAYGGATGDKWLLNSEDSWYFFLAFTA